jgi:DDE superfamily endonuclease
MQLTRSFLDLLQHFVPVFTSPTFLTFVTLVTGWCYSWRHRYVTELIQASAATHDGHHSRYHRFFSQAAWSLDNLWRVLATVLLRRFVPTGLVEVAVDDTLCRKRGLTLYGAGMHYDPLISSRALKLVSWGHDWVVLFLLVRCPWAPTTVWALPILCRLYRNRQGLTKGKKGQKKPPDPNHRTRPELAREMLALLACWFPQRQFLAYGDSAYGGKSILRHLPANVDLVSHVHPKGALYAPASPKKPGQKGPPRKKGARLPDKDGWAADLSQPWQELSFDQFGLHATLWVKVQQALYYEAGKDRRLTIVLTHDPAGKRPDLRLYCTRLDWDARQILSGYAGRWAVEVTFANSKQFLGFEDPANRTPLAVQRTAPVALVLYSLVVAWFHQVGHRLVAYPERPWYPQKATPSFADMLSTLRRVSWQEQCPGVPPESAPLEKWLGQLLAAASRTG